MHLCVALWALGQRTAQLLIVGNWMADDGNAGVRGRAARQKTGGTHSQNQALDWFEEEPKWAK